MHTAAFTAAAAAEVVELLEEKPRARQLLTYCFDPQPQIRQRGDQNWRALALSQQSLHIGNLETMHD